MKISSNSRSVEKLISVKHHEVGGVDVTVPIVDNTDDENEVDETWMVMRLLSEQYQTNF